MSQVTRGNLKRLHTRKQNKTQAYMILTFCRCGRKGRETERAKWERDGGKKSQQIIYRMEEMVANGQVCEFVKY